MSISLLICFAFPARGWLSARACWPAALFWADSTLAVILAGVFLLGTGFAVQAPVASAAIPEIVGKEELPSAIALGGIQMNLAGIIGPALGGLLIPFVGVSVVFAMNAIAFVIVLVAVSTWKRKNPEFNAPLERFFDSLAGAARYMRYAPGVQIILLRNFIFGVLIGAIPALLPVVGLKALHLDAVNLGLVFPRKVGRGERSSSLVSLDGDFGSEITIEESVG